jgi:hypothetical protein
MHMQIAEAVAEAKKFLSEVFAEQDISGLRLEEIEFDEAKRQWNITISFLRGGADSTASFLQEMISRQRVYKVITISDESGRMISIKSHATA